MKNNTKYNLHLNKYTVFIISGNRSNIWAEMAFHEAPAHRFLMTNDVLSMQTQRAAI